MFPVHTVEPFYYCHCDYCDYTLVSCGFDSGRIFLILVNGREVAHNKLIVENSHTISVMLSSMYKLHHIHIENVDLRRWIAIYAA